MNLIVEALRGVTALLSEAGATFALVGGFAVAVRAEPRFTRDVDLVVAVSGDAQAEALVGALRGHGYQVLAIVEQEAVKRLATVRLLPPGGLAGGVVIDLLFASSGIEPEVARSAEALELVDGLIVPVALRSHLLALKVLARDDRRRPQDLGDLRALLERATAEEVSEARAALALIAERGFHRGRALVSDLEALLADPG
jgi:predicted nucleotidyltransferase